MRLWISLPILFLVACGGSAAPSHSGPPIGTTSGGDAPAAAPPGMTAALRTTTPIPVPQPATPREHLSAPLQHVWELVETAVEVRPPEPPSAATQEAISAWATGPFHDWVGRRGEAVHAVEEAESPLQTSTGAERGIAAALFGYLYEETAAGAHGAPVPSDLAADAGLLQAYEDALLESLAPYARAAAESYAACVHAFNELNDAAWHEWGPYCLDHAREVVEVYHLAPPSAAHEAAPAAPPAPAPTSPRDP